MADDEEAPDESDESDESEESGGNRVAGAAKAVGGAATSALGRATRSAQTAKIISNIEDRLWAARRERKIGKGTLRDTHVAAYRGFASHGQAHMRIRVLEEPVVPDSTELLADPKIVRSNLRRFFALAFPGVKVQVLLGDASEQVTSDRHGFATAHLACHELAPGWHEYHAVTRPDDPDEHPRVATGEVLIPDPKAAFGVISDVDDTVLRTGLTEGLVAVRNTLMGSPESRRAIPGMSALYQGLVAGRGPNRGSLPEPAFYYVSTGPWNLYEVLTEFLDFRGFPKGVLFLTDWGPREQFVMRSGQEHKRLTINRIFAAYPNTNFVMIGDSGQHDPDIYVEFAKEFPGRVKAIVILDVGEHMAQRAEELRKLSEELEPEGINLNLVEDAVEAANVLADLGLVEDTVADAVAAAIANETER